MPVLNIQAISEEDHHEAVEQAIICDSSGCPVPCVRFFAPLVLVTLRRANNPYLTGRRGFDAIGVEFDGDKQLTPPADFVMMMMVKTAEVITLFSCSQDELKAFALDSAKLESAAMDLMSEKLDTMEKISDATIFVSEKMSILSKTQAKKSSEDDKPSAEGLGTSGKKKRGRTG